jgi:heme exporter protein A
VIEWRDVGKQFGRRRLFSGISGALEPGRSLVVTGPNGSGKSTFLRLLAGLARPDAGVVLRPDPPFSIGYASPDLATYGELTGRENLEFFRNIRGGGVDSASLLDRFGLSKAANRAVAHYSSGMRQRLKLAVAIAHEPDALLLDEPTLALDADGIALVDAIVADFVEAGKCIAIATNDASEAARWGTAKLDLR